MKFYYLSLLTILFLNLSCKSPETSKNDDSKDFKAVEQVVQDVFDDIWRDKKAELLTKYHTDDFILLEHGEV